VAVAEARADEEASYVQQTGAGLQPVESRRDADVWSASMLQEPAVFGIQADALHVMAAVGLLPADAHRELPPQTVSTGLPALVALVKSEDAIARVKPDFDLLEPLLARSGAANVYLAWYDGKHAVRARMFTRQIEGGEDPATGSAAGALCEYLHANGVASAVEISQGVEIMRASVLRAEMDGDRARVAGDVVVVIRGEVLL
jgi:trans-2,3-dihydro-3-hydroxyanthranilate isomerase